MNEGDTMIWSHNKGTLYILTGPSGSGKSTLIGEVLKKDPTFVFLPTFTTRPQRSGEVNGEAYHFISVEQFQKMYKNEQFIEWQNVNGFFYGSSIKLIQDTLKQGRDALTSLEIFGVLEVQTKFPTNICSIFVVPPSQKEQIRRIKYRGTESPHTLRKRIKRSKLELSFIDSFDYLIKNDLLDKATDQLIAAISAHRLRKDLIKFVQLKQKRSLVIRTVEFFCQNLNHSGGHNSIIRLPLLRINDFETEKTALKRMIRMISYRVLIKLNESEFRLTKITPKEIKHINGDSYIELRSICDVVVKSKKTIELLKRSLSIISVHP